jgi:hypothetical protein
MPPACPPHFVGLEFTGKFQSPAMLAIPPTIGINRLIAVAW